MGCGLPHKDDRIRGPGRTRPDRPPDSHAETPVECPNAVFSCSRRGLRPVLGDVPAGSGPRIGRKIID